MNKKKILITGGAGYIGSHIVEKLLKKNDLTILDNLSTGYKKFIFQKENFYRIDIKDSSKVKKIIQDQKIETIIHLAAKLSIQEAQKKPKQYFENNVLGTRSLLKAIKGTRVKNIIFSSTAAVYSGNKEIVCTENLKPKPTNLYGRIKFLSEIDIRSFCIKNNIKSVILRYFNVVGASPSKKIGPQRNYGQLFKKLSKIALNKNPTVVVYGDNHKTHDGSCIRDFIDINDIVNIHELILKKLNKIKNGTIINCGYGKGFSVFDIINVFSKIIKKKIHIKIVKKRKNEVSNIYADNSFLIKKLKWKPKYHNMISTIKSCLYWEKTNRFIK